jgi:DNA primase
MSLSHEIDVIDFLTTLGIEGIAPTGNEVVFRCPFPGHRHGDANPSASMNQKTTAWICFGCQRRGNAVTFLCELESINVIVAKRWLREAYQGGFKEPIGGSLQDELERYFDQKMDEVGEINPPIGEEWGKSLAIDWHMVTKADRSDTEGLHYMLDRGFSAQTLWEHQIGYDYADERVLIPIRNEEGSLVGFKGRAISPNQKPRYRVAGPPRYPFSPYKTAEVVFGLDSVTDDHLIVCEGELNVLMMRQHGFFNAVGISGASMSQRQAELIVARCHTATLYYDSDAAGNAGMRHAANMLYKHIAVNLLPPHTKDAADSTKEEVTQLYAQRKPLFDCQFSYPEYIHTIIDKDTA